MILMQTISEAEVAVAPLTGTRTYLVSIVNLVNTTDLVDLGLCARSILGCIRSPNIMAFPDGFRLLAKGLSDPVLERPTPWSRME